MPTKVTVPRTLYQDMDVEVEGGGPSSKIHVEAHKGKVISVYNYKGGVWKTSTVINLGATLARTHKVLLVDGDSQCNLTSFFNPIPDDPLEANNEDLQLAAGVVNPLPNLAVPIDPNEPQIVMVRSMAQKLVRLSCLPLLCLPPDWNNIFPFLHL